MRRSSRYILTLLALAPAAFSLACTSEKIVYRSGTNFATPPTAALSFVGYSDVTTQQTVCGSCHVDFQTRWAATKHASAWKDLQASGSAGTTCYACHAVSALGNASTDATAGYLGAQDPRYQDVQCENCHGAGLTHASSPTGSNIPLVSIQADTSIKNGCGECHSGTHEPFVNEWAGSNAAGLSHSHIQAHAQTSTDPTCKNCHSAQGALTSWGNTENYVEKTSTTWLPVVCAVCHDPHGSPNTAQLRFSISAANIDDNLCMKCHQRNSNASLDNTRNSVHSPQGPTLLGTAGWFPPGFDIADTIIGTHGTPSANPTMCAGCHVQRFTVNDKLTGKFVFQSTGHSFIAAPCVDANGQPTANQTCDISVQTFRSCAKASCHGSETAAKSAYTTAQARVNQLITQTNTYITQVKAGAKKGECSVPSTTGKYTTCNGASFNISLAQSPGAPAHNPFLIEQLLIASIAQLQKDYGLTAAASVSLAPQFTRPPRMRTLQGSPR